MGVTLEDLAPLFAAGLGHLQCRELCEAASGFKLSRLNLYPPQAAAVAGWCRRHGLSLALSDFGVEEHVAEEGKGQWSNMGRRVPPGQGLRFAYVSRDPAEVECARASEASGDGDARAMGRLLRIPPCCTRFYLEHRREAVAAYADEYAPITLRATTAPPPYPWRANYLAQYFGFSLTHHYPCAWDCGPSLERARRSEAVVRAVSPAWLATFRQHMRGVVVFENLRAVHLILAPPGPREVRFRPYQLHSTAPTELGRALRRSGRLTWSSPRSFAVEPSGVDADTFASADADTGAGPNADTPAHVVAVEPGWSAADDGVETLVLPFA